MTPEQKQVLLNDYFEALRVLQWAKDNEMLKPDEHDRIPSQLAFLYAASSREEKDWLNDQLSDR